MGSSEAEARSGKRNFLIRSALSLVSTSIVTSLLGFVYWTVAARMFAVTDVGESTTAIAATAAEAEALSTACYVLGPAGADQLLAKHREIGCLMLCPGETVGAVEIHSWNIEGGEWLPA